MVHEKDPAKSFDRRSGLSFAARRLVRPQLNLKYRASCAGRWREALGLRDRMLAEGIKLDGYSFNALIEACSKGGQVSHFASRSSSSTTWIGVYMLLCQGTDLSRPESVSRLFTTRIGLRTVSSVEILFVRNETKHSCVRRNYSETMSTW